MEGVFFGDRDELPFSTEGLFEIRLFNDDLRAILRAQSEILRTNLTYLKLSLWPMVWILPPLVLVMVQLQFHYGYSGLEIDDPVLLEVDFKEGRVSEEPTAESGGLDAEPIRRIL